MDEFLKEITIKDLSPKNIPNQINLFLRGSTFRTSFMDQENCIKSLFSNLLADLIKNKIKIQIILTTYKNDKDYLLIKFIKNFLNCDLIDNRLDAKKFKNQSDSFIEILKIANNISGSSIITRADLKFTKYIPLNRLDKNFFLFQWKYFHDYKIKEVPDQLHFVGENQKKNVYEICKKNCKNLGLLPDETGYYTLHNLYNILNSNNIKISYIFDFLNVKYNGYYCNLRGNSHKSKIKHFYEYTTPPPKKPILKKIRSFLTEKLNFYFI